MVCLLSQSRDDDPFLDPRWLQLALGNNSFSSWSHGAGSYHLLIKLSITTTSWFMGSLSPVLVAVKLEWRWSVTSWLSRVLFVLSCRCMFMLDHTLHFPLGVTIEDLFVHCCAVTRLTVRSCSTKQRRWTPLASAVHFTHLIERVWCWSNRFDGDLRLVLN